VGLLSVGSTWSALSASKESDYAPAAIAFDSIWAFSSGEHFNVNPHRLQRIKWFPPSGITGMKKSVNHRFDSIAVNMVGREHFEQEY
jgi:hypothetical protein